ncbi:MAG: endolytic transglycosylase MltG [bacterium]
MLIFCIYLFTKTITLDTKITIDQGESTAKIFNQLGPIEKIRVKLYIKTHNIDFSKLEAGNYTFSGSYSRAEFVENILKGSEKEYLRLTILEGRSIYDIDEALTRK